MLHCLHSAFDQKKWKNSVSKPSAITKRDMVQMWRVCTVIFFDFSVAPLVEDGSPGGRTGDMVQLWRVCAVFFGFSVAPLVEDGSPGGVQMCGIYAYHSQFGRPYHCL